MAEARQRPDGLGERDEFAGRHIGPNEGEIATTMLGVLGLSFMAELIDRTVPTSIRTRRPLALPPPLTETEALARLRELAAANRLAVPLIGMGYHGTTTPPVILRNLLENPGWYTTYTPYQAEVSQGRLEALLNYQQTVIDLTGMELANASLLDEATAAAEAVTMAPPSGCPWPAGPAAARPTPSSSTRFATRRRSPSSAPGPATSAFTSSSATRSPSWRATTCSGRCSSTRRPTARCATCAPPSRPSRLRAGWRRWRPTSWRSAS